MITHVVTFRWKPNIPAGQVDAVTSALRALPASIPAIRSYSFGPNAGVSPKANADYAVVATFDAAAAWHEYDEHAEHERVRSSLILPWALDRSGIQFES